VSNFNASSNSQGTGTTIVDVSPGGALSLFAQIDPTKLPGPCPGGVGLTTALAVLRSGWVIVGSLPTSDGTSATAQAGCLIVLNSSGIPAETIYGSLINGPWDMTAADGGDKAALFVTNVLNGTVAADGNVVNQATVVRINLAVSEKQMPFLLSMTVIGAGLAARTDPAALVIGPTGVGLSPSCHQGEDSDCRPSFGEDESVLYVADSVNNRIAVNHRSVYPLHSFVEWADSHHGWQPGRSPRTDRRSRWAHHHGKWQRWLRYGDHSARSADREEAAGQHGRSAPWYLAYCSIRKLGWCLLTTARTL